MKSLRILLPVADVLAAYLNQTDYRAALLQAGQGRAARNVAKLLADAHRSETISAIRQFRCIRTTS